VNEKSGETEGYFILKKIYMSIAKFTEVLK